MDKIDKSLIAKIEAVLFVHGEPLKVKRLASLTGASEAQVEKALEDLKNSFSDENRRGGTSRRVKRGLLR